jgi:hypothetical protein
VKWLSRVGLAVVLLVAAALRLSGLDWDAYQHHHPDERYISWVATTIEFPAPSSPSWAGALDTTSSTFNPFRWPAGAGSEGIVVLQDQPRDFAYGHLPLYLGVMATRVTERLSVPLSPLVPENWRVLADVLNVPDRVEFQHLTAVSRALTALVDVFTVLLTYLLGRRLGGRAVGLLAAALLAVTVLHIQLAHFFLADTYLTFFVTASLVAMISAHQARDDGTRLAYLVAAGGLVGLAVGSKFSAVLLLVALGWTAWRVGGSWRRLAAWGGLALGTAAIAFALTNPFALLDTSCPVTISVIPFVPEFTVGSCYLDNLRVQNAMVGGALDLGFTRQYTGTIPYLYFIEMQLRWGLGWALGLFVLAGAAWGAWRVGRTIWASRRLPERSPEVELMTLLLWISPYFLATGAFYVKFMRYMQPIIPALIVLGAMALWALPRPRLRGFLAATVFGLTALYAVAFVNLYREPHPWNSASEWIHRHVPSGALILSEQWDDYLPVSMLVDGEVRRRGAYENAELTWLSDPDGGDDEAKLDANLTLLAEGDYVTILSQRVYGVVPRLPERYPLSSRYYQQLFDGALGYELVWVGGRGPNLGGVTLQPDLFGWPGLRPPAGVTDYLNNSAALRLGRVDESFTVYDQPLTMIFRNTGRLSVAELRAELLGP